MRRIDIQRILHEVRADCLRFRSGVVAGNHDPPLLACHLAGACKDLRQTGDVVYNIQHPAFGQAADFPDRLIGRRQIV